MKDERILAIRDKVNKEFVLAEDSFESAVLLYEAEKYRASIPFFIDSIKKGVKSLLMCYQDEYPQDLSALIKAFYGSQLSEKIELEKRLDEIFNELKNLEQKLNKHPLTTDKDELKKLEEFYKKISQFIDQARKIIKSTLRTSKEIKKRKKYRRIAFGTIGVLVGLVIIFQAINFIRSLDNGLHGKYYADENFTQLIDARKDKNIDFDWGLGTIIDEYADKVYVRWFGELEIPQSGTYTFITKIDDGIRLWIDEELIIEDWKTHLITRDAKIRLRKGIHNIRIEYFESGGPGCIRLFWIRPDKNKRTIIPPKYFVYKKKQGALFLDSSQEISNIPVGQIIKGKEVGQTFYCYHNNLARIKVRLATYKRRNRQDVIFHLKKSPSAKKDIFTKTFNASDVQDNKYRCFDFSPISDSKGKSYYFSFESPKSKKGDAITI